RADRPGSQRAAARLAEREVRSYEAEAVGALWHLDFHHGSRQVLMPDGRYVKPYLLGVLDDHSRLCCHLQWYLGETAENLVHGLGQALQKRGLPRALLTDNGAAMIASEVEQGLVRLGIVHETTLPESPYQNGKQESFWASVEGRLMAMLEGVRDLALPALNEATLAWAEMEYNRTVHSEISEPPLQRFLRGPDRSRRAPASEELRLAFTTEVLRRQRRSDGTASLDGVRFEIPGRYRQFERVALRHASWDLSRVWLADPRHGHVLCPIYPVDKARNASGQRRTLEPILAPPQAQPPASGMAPLLRALLERYAATGLPPAYLPQPATDTDPEEKP
ncbi:MAG: transposase family protein, partial [Acidobacteriota bacterium]